MGSAKGASSPRKGPCPPSVLTSCYELSFSLIRADSRRIYERKVVMEAKPLAARPSLEQYKKQAKELVKLFRAAQSSKSPDSEAIHSETIRRVKQLHPRFADLPDAQIGGAKFALADAQFVLAREHGFESWPKFAQRVEAQAAASFVASVDDPVAAFLMAASVPRDDWHASGTLEQAEAILAAHPHVASANVYTAAVLGDAATVRRFLAADPISATAKGGPHNWDALTHLCFSRYLRLDRARSAAFVSTAQALLDAGATGIAKHADLTRLLLTSGADPNDEETPYHVPEGYDNTVVKLLLESGKLSAMSLVVMLIRKTDWHDLEGLRLVLEHGGDPNLMSRFGDNTLHHA